MTEVSLRFRGRVRAGVRILGLAMGLGALAVAAGAQESISLQESFDAYADRYRDARVAPDEERLEQLLTRIQALRVERNAFQLHDLASGFVLQALADLESGRLEEARRTLEVAEVLDPALPAVYWARAFAGSGDGSLNPVSAWGLGIRGWLAAWQSLWNRDFFLAAFSTSFLAVCSQRSRSSPAPSSIGTLGCCTTNFRSDSPRLTRRFC